MPKHGMPMKKQTQSNIAIHHEQSTPRCKFEPYLPAGLEQLSVGQGILLLDQQLPTIGLLLQLSLIE